MQPLLDACRYGDLEEVRELLETHAEIAADTLSRCLYEAAYAGLVDALPLLFAKGAKPVGTFHSGLRKRIAGQSALSALIAYGDHEARETLHKAVVAFLDHGADPNLRDAELGGRTPLSQAANHHLVEVVQTLLAAGADPTLLVGRPGRQEDALYEVFTRNSDPTAMARITEMLLGAGAEPDRPCGGWGRTPLMMAAAAGAAEACRLLIAAGADVNRRDGDGETAYSLASARAQSEVCELLLEAGAKVSPEEELRAQLIACHKEGDWPRLRELSGSALLAFGDVDWVVQLVSLAFENTGDIESAIACAREGLRRNVSEVLLSRTVVALMRSGDAKEALKVWQLHRDEVADEGNDRFLLANLLAIYDEVGLRSEGLREVEARIPNAKPGGDQGLLDFNLACLWTKEGQLARALEHLEASLVAGKERGSLEREPDLAPLLAHPACQKFLAEGPASVALRRDGGWPVRELALRGCDLVERTLDRAGDVPRVSERECSSRARATWAYWERRAELLEAGHAECAPPALEVWPAVFEEVLGAWAKAQAAGRLGPLGAFVAEWDFGESPGERTLWIAGYGPADETTYESYVYGDEALVDESTEGPCIDTPEVFAAIVARVLQCAAFGALDKGASFSFVLQEHDAGHEHTVVWRK